MHIRIRLTAVHDCALPTIRLQVSHPSLVMWKLTGLQAGSLN